MLKVNLISTKNIGLKKTSLSGRQDDPVWCREHSPGTGSSGLAQGGRSAGALQFNTWE